MLKHGESGILTQKRMSGRANLLGERTSLLRTVLDGKRRSLGCTSGLYKGSELLSGCRTMTQSVRRCQPLNLIAVKAIQEESDVGWKHGPRGIITVGDCAITPLKEYAALREASGTSSQTEDL